MPVMVEIIVRQNGSNRMGDLSEVPSLLNLPDVALWVDLNSATGEELKQLQAVFHFHDLAMADCQETITRPGIQDYENHCFLTVHTPVFDKPDQEPEDQELNVFLGERYIVTVHHRPLVPLATIFEQCKKGGGPLVRGADYVYYSVMDDIVDGYFTVLNQYDDAIDDLEDEILRSPSTHTLERVSLIKRQLIHLRRIIGPQREVFALLNNREFPYISTKTIVYFRDVHEHLLRVYELIDSLRELLTSALEVYISVQSQRLNEIMKVLALVSTVLLPMNLVASVYGMNFVIHVPHQDEPLGFHFAVLMMVAVGLGFLYWFKRRKWF